MFEPMFVQVWLGLVAQNLSHSAGLGVLGLHSKSCSMFKLCPISWVIVCKKNHTKRLNSLFLRKNMKNVLPQQCKYHWNNRQRLKALIEFHHIILQGKQCQPILGLLCLLRTHTSLHQCWYSRDIFWKDN